MPELLLALDAGTTTVRACLFTPAGDLLGRAAARVETRSPAPGRLEQDGAAIWASAERLMAEVLGDRTLGDVAAIGVTTQRTSAMVWDRDTAEALTPLVVWSDLRGAARSAALRELGFPVSPQQAAAKLEGLVAAAGAGRRLAWGNIDSYLIFRLTGEHAMDRSQAWPTGYLGLDMSWNPHVIEAQRLDPAIFPTLVDTWGVIGRTREGVPVAADVADQQGAMIGHGAETAGAGKVTYGTSATLNLSTGSEFVWKGGAVPPFIVSSAGGATRFCLEGMVYSAGSALDWLREGLGLGAPEAFSALAATAQSDGVAVLPAFQGLGAPYADLGTRAKIVGLSFASGKAAIARAGVEGVAFRVKEVFDHLYAETGYPRPDVLPVDGGLSASDALMQAQADFLARPVARHALREATAAGAAICAARGIGLFAPEDTGGFARYDRTFEPALSADEAQARYAAWKAAVG